MSAAGDRFESDVGDKDARDRDTIFSENRKLMVSFF
jgi:hypothetical protein